MRRPAPLDHRAAGCVCVPPAQLPTPRSVEDLLPSGCDALGRPASKPPFETADREPLVTSCGESLNVSWRFQRDGASMTLVAPRKRGRGSRCLSATKSLTRRCFCEGVSSCAYLGARALQIEREHLWSAWRQEFMLFEPSFEKYSLIHTPTGGVTDHRRRQHND